jgi:hypothetical protein
MRKLGAYCRSSADAWFEASLIVVDADRLINQQSVVCAHAGDEAAGLEELRRATLELLKAAEPDEVVVWELVPVPFGIPGGIRGAAPGIRAEGVVLSAAAAVDVPVRLSDRHAVLDAGNQSKIQAAVRQLAAHLSPAPESPAAEHAAAIAMA